MADPLLDFAASTRLATYNGKANVEERVTVAANFAYHCRRTA